MINVDEFVQLLKEHDLKVTPQRLEILKYLATHKIHPTANKIYSALKKRNPSLSKTTIYNSLDTLYKHKIINLLTISTTEMRYDFNVKAHHHFLCRICGTIIDIDVDCPYMENILKGRHKIEEVHGYFKGICKDCLT